MADYVLTGGATGIGAATKQLLLDAGHNVFVIDLAEGDVKADLSFPEDRAEAIAAIEKAFPDGIDGFIPCAGLGPSARPFSLIIKVNYFAVIEMTRALMPLLEKKKGAVVLVSSNSSSMPGLNLDHLEALKAEDEDRACDLINTLDGHNAYAGGKYALTTWMRRNNADWAAKGVRVNAVAPGITRTPLTDKVMDDEVLGDAMKQFGESVPLGKLAEPAEIANVIAFLVSDQASFISGSVFFVDGGHDAMLRPDNF